MDEDLIAFGIVMVLFLSFPFMIVMGITGCIAYSRTKAWDKARNQGAISLESTRLVENAADDESDFYDTDDEENHTKRKAEEEADSTLTFNQKLRKEFKKCWNGKGREDIIKNKEREERKKLARSVVRALERRARKQERQAAQGQTEELPPSYKN
jgi:Skp family chaperone for outer membrane proteins